MPKSSMTVKVEGSNLVITMPIVRPLKKSKSEKSLVVATSHGNVPTSATIDDKPIVVGVNAYIKAD